MSDLFANPVDWLDKRVIDLLCNAKKSIFTILASSNAINLSIIIIIIIISYVYTAELNCFMVL